MPNDTYLPPVCAACLEHDGLCVRHLPEVCPQLKQPSWHRHAHSGMYHETNKAAAEEDPKARRIRLRKERKARERALRPPGPPRLARALRGEFTPCRPQAAA